MNPFDVSDLTEDERGHLEWVLNSPSYERVFKPFLLRWQGDIRKTLEDPNTERKNKFSDDFLRGEIATINGLLSFLDELVANTNMQRMAEAQQHTPDQEYEKLRALNFIRHSGQTAPPRVIDNADY